MAPSNNVTVAPTSPLPVMVGVSSLVMLSLAVPESDAASSVSAVGAAGALVSSVTVSAPLAAETLPAMSVCFEVIDSGPAVSVLVVTDQLPSAAAVPVPTAVAPLKIVTVAPGSAPVPVKVGVARLVMLSVDEAPRSEAAVRSGVDGAAAVVSIVKP